jgi:hypothetical protein
MSLYFSTIHSGRAYYSLPSKRRKDDTDSVDEVLHDYNVIAYFKEFIIVNRKRLLPENVQHLLKSNRNDLFR